MAETGFLVEGDPQLFRAKLYIAAMGRSGSTALANMLTTPPRRWVLSEPWFIQGAMSKAIRDRWAEFGWSSEDKNWWLPAAQRTHESFVRRYSEFLAPHLAKLEAWGVKEVRGDFHEPTIATIRPEKIIILVRDIRAVIRSLLEKQIRQGTETTHGRPWIEQYITSAAASLTNLADVHAAKVVRFEELMGSASGQDELANWLDWPLNGDPHARLADYGRDYEIRRQEGTEPRILPPDADKVIDEITEGAEAARYQARFGY